MAIVANAPSPQKNAMVGKYINLTCLYRNKDKNVHRYADIREGKDRER